MSYEWLVNMDEQTTNPPRLAEDKIWWSEQRVYKDQPLISCLPAECQRTDVEASGRPVSFVQLTVPSRIA
jgi:hypothetical protein